MIGRGYRTNQYTVIHVLGSVWVGDATNAIFFVSRNLAFFSGSNARSVALIELSVWKYRDLATFCSSKRKSVAQVFNYHNNKALLSVYLAGSPQEHLLFFAKSWKVFLDC